jgi:predicted RND superfamily exporter protein
MSIQEAYYGALTTTGEAVSLTGAMLAVGVATWMWSPIKFQADMGMLLTFMFVWNMVGALWLLPALAQLLIKPEKFVEQRNKRLAKLATGP